MPQRCWQWALLTAALAQPFSMLTKSTIHSTQPASTFAQSRLSMIILGSWDFTVCFVAAKAMNFPWVHWDNWTGGGEHVANALWCLILFSTLMNTVGLPIRNLLGHDHFGKMTLDSPSFCFWKWLSGLSLDPSGSVIAKGSNTSNVLSHAFA